MNADAVMQELMAREPIFHRTQFARTQEQFAQIMAADYWEIGASGRRYDREFILQHLQANPPVDAAAAGWKCLDFALRELGAETFLLTYELQQGERHSRRATVWRKDKGHWMALYHQGTLTERPGVDSSA